MPENPFSEDFLYREYKPHRNPLMDIHLRLKEVERLNIAMLELDYQGILSETARREGVHRREEHVIALGLRDIDDEEGFINLYGKLHEAIEKPPVPPDFPHKEEFLASLASAITKPCIGTRFLHTLIGRRTEFRPPVAENQIKASDVAKYGHTEWWTLQTRGTLL